MEELKQIATQKYKKIGIKMKNQFPPVFHSYIDRRSSIQDSHGIAAKFPFNSRMHNITESGHSRKRFQIINSIANHGKWTYPDEREWIGRILQKMWILLYDNISVTLGNTVENGEKQRER